MNTQRKTRTAARSIARLTRAFRDAVRLLEDYRRAAGEDRERLSQEISRMALQFDVLRARMNLSMADATAALLAGDERPARRRMLRLQSEWEQAYAKLIDAYERTLQEENGNG